jgi:hypothetical protein
LLSGFVLVLVALPRLVGNSVVGFFLFEFGSLDNFLRCPAFWWFIIFVVVLGVFWGGS